MPITAPIIIEIDKNTWLINEYKGTLSYLILGSDKGLLIDCNSSSIDYDKVATRLFKGKSYDFISTNPSNYNSFEDEIIDLGKRKIRLIHTPGNTKNSVSYYDENSGIIFTGNALLSHIYLEEAVSDELLSLLRIRSLKPKRIYPSKLDLDDYRSLKEDVLEDAIGASRAFLHSSREAYLDKVDSNTIVYGKVKITLKEGKIWNEGEPHTPYPMGM